MQQIRFLTYADVKPWFEGKSVAIVGSGPGCVDNEPGKIDGHDVVVRVNNYKLKNRLRAGTGSRTDVFYSFFGTSIRKSAAELKCDGVRLCMCKCPDAHAIDSDWHRRNGKMVGVDFRWIYKRRREWWFCDTYVPGRAAFLKTFNMLGSHVPTTGFAAVLDVLSFDPARVYLTGFDFFTSGIHNVDQRWKQKNNGDPIGHVPARELAWVREAMKDYNVEVDAALAAVI